MNADDCEVRNEDEPSSEVKDSVANSQYLTTTYHGHFSFLKWLNNENWTGILLEFIVSGCCFLYVLSHYSSEAINKTAKRTIM